MATTRARDEAARDGRREAILGAAARLLAEDGFEAVTMARLAEAAALAKGTTYLYFRTREEVFLALFVRALDAWADVIAADVPAPGPDGTGLVEAMVDAAGRDPAFLPLLARLGAVIEQNLARDALYEAKRAVWAAFGRVSAHLGRALALGEADARRLAVAVMVALQGAAQSCAAAVPDDPAMPEDVRAAFALSDFGALARVALGLAVAGALAQRSSIST